MNAPEWLCGSAQAGGMGSCQDLLTHCEQCSRTPVTLGARKRDFALLTPTVATVFNTPKPRAARHHCFPHTCAKSPSLGNLSHRVSRGDGTGVSTARGRHASAHSEAAGNEVVGKQNKNKISAYETWRELSLWNHTLRSRQRRRRSSPSLHDVKANMEGTMLSWGARKCW